MTLRLDNFKQAISSTILTRGRDYYRKGHVVDLSQDDEDVWIAQVQGTELYEVIIEQAPDGSLNASCSCPYEDDYCKHVAAVLYAIEEAYPDAQPDKAKKRKAKAPKQTKRDKLKTALLNTSHEQLVDLLMVLAEGNRELSNQLQLSLGLTGDSPSNYTRMVKDALRVGRGEYGYIDYYGAGRAAKKLDELLAQGSRMIEDGRIEPAVALYQAILEQVAAVLTDSDDSNGALSDCIANAFEGLRRGAPRLPPPSRFALFEYALKQARNKVFTNFDWQWDLFDLAASLVHTREERAILFDALDSPRPTEAVDEVYRRFNSYASSEFNTFFSQREREHAELIKLDVIERMDGEAAAQAFIESHMHLHGFRQRVIEQHMARGDLERAKQVAQDGITQSQKERLPGLTLDYQALLLAVAEQQHDTAAIVPLARALWLRHGEERYYALMKATVPAQEWPAMVETLVRDARQLPEFVAYIYEKEGMWLRLLQLVQSRDVYSIYGVQLLNHYRDKLEQRFPDEIASIYEKQVERLMENAYGRDSYQKASEYLRRMKALGKDERVRAIVADLRARFPKRRAMHEELDKV